MKKETHIICQGCLKPFLNTEIFIVKKDNHSIYACEKCCKSEYKEYSSLPYLIENKINKTKESFTKTGITKDNIKIKIGETYNNIVVNSIKKISKSGEYDKKKKDVITEITFFISENKTDWIKI